MSFASREELAWAGGFFEGEGCFTMASTPARKNHYARAQLSGTDRDAMERFIRAVGFGTLNGPYKYGSEKPIYKWGTQGFERTQALVAMLWPFLGQRRRTRAAEVLSAHGQEVHHVI